MLTPLGFFARPRDLSKRHTLHLPDQLASTRARSGSGGLRTQLTGIGQDAAQGCPAPAFEALILFDRPYFSALWLNDSGGHFVCPRRLDRRKVEGPITPITV